MALHAGLRPQGRLLERRRNKSFALRTPPLLTYTNTRMFEFLDDWSLTVFEVLIMTLQTNQQKLGVRGRPYHPVRNTSSSGELQD